MEVKVTAKELLELTIKELEGITVPVSMANDVARPIWNAVQNLRQVADALQEPEKPEEVKEDNV